MASAVTPTRARLTWSAANDNVEVVRYEIEMDGVVMANRTRDFLSAMMTDLVPNSRVDCTVYAVDGAGNRSAGPTLSLEVPNYEQPRWPEGSWVEVHDITPTSAVCWTHLLRTPHHPICYLSR